MACEKRSSHLWETFHGYLILNDDLDTMDYLDILNKYNLNKEQLIKKYIDLKARESSDMLFLGLTILITIAMVVILDLSNNGLAIPIGATLGKYVERKITSKRKKLLKEIYTDNEKSNEIFNRICHKNEYFQYCLSYLISNKEISSIFYMNFKK